MLAAVILATTSAEAQVTYIGAANGQWGTNTNWSGNAVPTSSNNVFVDNGVQVRIQTAGVANNLTIGGTGGLSDVSLRNGGFSLTVGGSIVMGPGAGNAVLRLGVGTGAAPTLTIAGGTGSIVDGGGAGTTDIAVYGPMTVNLRSVAVDTLSLNQNSSGSLTIGAGQNWTVTTTYIGGAYSNVTDDLTVSGTLNSTNVRVGDAAVTGTNRATLNLETGGVILAQTLQRSNAMETVFNWNGGTIQNKSGVDLSVTGAGGNTLTISLAGTGTHSFVADSGRTITVSSTVVLANKSGENGTLDKSGAGTLILQGANTYTGATTLSAGTLRLSNQNAIQNSTLTMNGGSMAFDSSVSGNAFTAGGLSGTSSGAGFDIALQNNAGTPAAITLTVGGNNASTTYAGVLSAAGGLTKSGSGVLTLTGANTFSGATTVSSGSLQIGSGGTTGAIGSTSGVSVASGATLAFNRSDDYGGNFTRTITGSGGTVLSSGTLTLQNTGNTFSGGIAVNGGVLKSLGNSAGNTITVNNGGSLGMAGTDTWGAATGTSTPAITINAGGSMTTDGQFNSLRNVTLAGGTISLNGGLASTSSALVLGGTVTASGPVASQIVVASGSNNAIRLGRQGTSEATEFNVSDPAGSLSAGTVLDNNFGSISGLTKSGSGLLVLSAANTYTGPTTVSAGTLRVGNGGTTGSITANSALTVASGATLTFNRTDDYGGALTNTFSGSGTVVVNSGTLGLNAAGASGYSSNLGFVINNGGSVVLSHSDTFGGTGWDATASPAFTVNAGGVLSSTNSYNTLWNATLNGGTLRSNGGANGAAQAFALAGTLTVGGSTASLIESGTIGNGLNAVNISGNGNNTLTMNVADATGNANADLTVTAILQNNRGTLSNLTKSGAGTLVLTAANTYTGTTTVSSGVLQIGSGGSAGAIGSTASISVGTGATLAFNRSDNYGGAFDRQITGSGAVTLSSGSLVLTNNDTYSGATTISAGTLQIGSGGTAGAIGSTSGVSVASGATLAFNRSDAYGGNFTRTITGSGGVVVSSGTLTLQNTGNTLSGGFTVNGGVLSSLGASITASNSVTVNSGGTFGMAGTDTWGAATTTSTPAITINAGGNMTTDNQFNSLRNLTLAGGTVTFNGGLNSSAGALVLGGTVAVNGATTSTLVVTTGSNNFIRLGRQNTSEATEFNVSNAGGQLAAGVSLQDNFGASSGLTKSGAGTMVMTGSNNYTGATTVSAGTLQIGSGGSIGSTASISVGTGATLAFNRSDNYGGAFDRQITGSGAVTLSSGSLVLTNNDTYSGATTISAGTLQIGSGGTAGAIGSTSGVSVASGATLAFNRSDAYGGNFTRTITGSGGVVVSSGTLTLQNTGNTLSGGFTVNGGVLRSLGASIAVSNSVTVNSGGTFGMAGTDTWGNAGATSTPAVTVNAGGNLTTDNQFNSLRNLTLAGGTVTLNGGLNSSAGALVLGGTVAVNGATTSTFAVTTGSNNWIRLGREGTSEATTFNVANAAGQLLAGVDLQNNFGASVSGLTKTGPGTMVLSGSNGYLGATTISAGRLLVNGTNAGTGGTTVDAGALLGGSGLINGLVTVSGTLSPGNSPGLLTLSSLVLTSTATTLMEIDGLTRGSQYDGIDLTTAGGLTYAGALSIAFGLGSAVADNTTFDLFNFSGTPTGDFASVISTGGVYAGTWSQVSSGTWSLQSGAQTLTFSAATGDVIIVPEPGTLALLAGVGAATAIALARRRK